MSQRSRATEREATPHSINSTNDQSISEALKRRAQSIINDKSIDAETRAIVRYALETNDPWLGDLVRRADPGETVIDNLNIQPTTKEKVATLAEMICRAGDAPHVWRFPASPSGPTARLMLEGDISS